MMNENFTKLVALGLEKTPKLSMAGEARALRAKQAASDQRVRKRVARLSECGQALRAKVVARMNRDAGNEQHQTDGHVLHAIPPREEAPPTHEQVRIEAR